MDSTDSTLIVPEPKWKNRREILICFHYLPVYYAQSPR